MSAEVRRRRKIAALLAKHMPTERHISLLLELEKLRAGRRDIRINQLEQGAVQRGSMALGFLANVDEHKVKKASYERTAELCAQFIAKALEKGLVLLDEVPPDVDADYGEDDDDTLDDLESLEGLEV